MCRILTNKSWKKRGGGGGGGGAKDRDKGGNIMRCVHSLAIGPLEGFGHAEVKIGNGEGLGGGRKEGETGSPSTAWICAWPQCK